VSEIKIKSIFEFQAYREFLVDRCGPSSRRLGVKRALAVALRCQPTYISQILQGRAELSLEQAYAAGEYFGFTNAELQYFLLLAQHARAGTPKLRKHFERDIERVQAERMTFEGRLPNKATLSREDQATYYGSWHFGAVHMALTLPEMTSADQIARLLGIPRTRVQGALEFLLGTGLARKEGDAWRVGESRIFLGNSSENIIRHHANWRTRALESLDRESTRDTHYSAVVTLSREDVLKLKERILAFVQESVQMIRKSKEEELCAFTIDFFSLGRSGDSI
jgi:uncharacterized protein (TIGR02147 family)